MDGSLSCCPALLSLLPAVHLSRSSAVPPAAGEGGSKVQVGGEVADGQGTSNAYGS